MPKWTTRRKRRRPRRRSFENRSVVITGAAGGMGEAFARRFGRAGSRLALLDLNREKAGLLAAQLREEGIDASSYRCDVTDESECSRVFDEIIAAGGGIDLLINNAGITHRSAFRTTQPEVIRRVVQVSLFGAVNCTKGALESLIERRGMVVAVSSAAGFVPLLGRTGYCAAKHGMHGFFDTLRAEMHGSGVDVLILCPGFTRTPLTTSALDGNGGITRHPKATVGKIAEPAEVAEELYLAACRRRRMVVLSASGKLSMLLSRLSPPLYEALMRRSLRKELDRDPR